MMDEVDTDATSSCSRGSTFDHGRLVFEEEKQAAPGRDSSHNRNNSVASQHVLSAFAKDQAVYLRQGDKGVIRIAKVKLEGKKACPAVEALRPIWTATKRSLAGARH